MGSKMSLSNSSLTKDIPSGTKLIQNHLKLEYSHLADAGDPKDWLPTEVTMSKLDLLLPSQEAEFGTQETTKDIPSVDKLSLPMTPFSFKRSRGQHPDGPLTLVPPNTENSSFPSSHSTQKRRSLSKMAHGDDRYNINSKKSSGKLPAWYPQVKTSAASTNLVSARKRTRSLPSAALGLAKRSKDSFIRRAFRFGRLPASDTLVQNRPEPRASLPVAAAVQPPVTQPENPVNLSANDAKSSKHGSPDSAAYSSYSDDYSSSKASYSSYPTYSSASTPPAKKPPKTPLKTPSKKASPQKPPKAPPPSSTPTTKTASSYKTPTSSAKSPTTGGTQTTKTGGESTSEGSSGSGTPGTSSGSPRPKVYSTYGGNKRGPYGNKKIPPPPVFISSYGSGSSTIRKEKSPADRLQNVDIVEELSYSCPDDSCNTTCKCSCDYYACCNDCGQYSIVPCCTCTPEKGSNPVKYCRRQRFNFDDGKPKADPCEGPPFQWPCCRTKNPYDDIPVGKNPSPEVVSCAIKTSIGCDPSDCGQVLPSESGTYFYDAERKCFVPVIEVKGPETPKREIIDEVIEEEPVLTNIEPIIQPVLDGARGGPCGAFGPIQPPCCGNLQGSFIPANLPGCSTSGGGGSRGPGCSEDVGMKVLGGMNMNGLAAMGPYGSIAVPQFNYVPPPPPPCAPNGPCPPGCPQGPCPPCVPCQPNINGPICFPGYPFPMCPPGMGQNKKNKKKGKKSGGKAYTNSGTGGTNYAYNDQSTGGYSGGGGGGGSAGYGGSYDDE